MADPDFTDTGRAALLWVLWHHQGGSSPVGQAVRFALGMGQFDRLTGQQIAQAKSWAAPIPGLAHMPATSVPVVVATNPSRDQGPCTVCGKLWRDHGTCPVYEDHHYTPASGVEACATEQDCEWQPWCRMHGNCRKKVEADRTAKYVAGVNPSHETQQEKQR